MHQRDRTSTVKQGGAVKKVGSVFDRLTNASAASNRKQSEAQLRKKRPLKAGEKPGLQAPGL